MCYNEIGGILMLYIGSHVGFNKNTQLLGSLEEALSYEATTFMFYTGAPQNTARCPIDDNLSEKAKEEMQKHNIDIDKVVVHAPYIINLCNETNFEFSVSFLAEEVKRVEKLGIHSMVLHPGSHVGLGVEKGIQNIINGLNKVLEMVGDTKVVILLETMAGKGSEVGTNIKQIKEIIEGVHKKENIGVCLDTCHLNDSGYDIGKFDEYLEEFDHEIGLSKIGCVHINDSKNPRESHKDRHENIGFGTIGFDNLIHVIYHPKLENVPKILETPYVEKLYAPYKEEIKMIRKKILNPNLLEDVKKD